MQARTEKFTNKIETGCGKLRKTTPPHLQTIPRTVRQMGCISSCAVLFLLRVFHIFDQIFHSAMEYLTKIIQLGCGDTFSLADTVDRRAADVILVDKRIRTFAAITHRLPESVINNHTITYYKGYLIARLLTMVDIKTTLIIVILTTTQSKRGDRYEKMDAENDEYWKEEQDTDRTK